MKIEKGIGDEKELWGKCKKVDGSLLGSFDCTVIAGLRQRRPR